MDRLAKRTRFGTLFCHAMRAARIRVEISQITIRPVTRCVVEKWEAFIAPDRCGSERFREMARGRKLCGRGDAMSSLRFAVVVAVVVLWVECESRAAAPPPVLSLAGGEFVVKRFEAPAYVENDYSRRFRFDRHDNPRLKELRWRYKLDEVVASGKDEFEKQVLLLDWVHHRFRKFGRPTSDAKGALQILSANDAGHTFFCAHYADVMVSAAASLGWVCRGLALRRPDHIGSGATEHSSTEIWSNQHRRWVMFDPTFAMYVEKEGVPLNAFEVRQEWFYRDGKDLVFVIGKERKQFRKSDLPIFRQRFAGFGDLSVDGSALNVYAFIGYIPNTDLMDSGKDYGRMFITQDRLCEGTKWHKRDVPKDPAAEPYFPINRASLTLTPEGGSVRVGVRTLTPNLRACMIRIDGGDWRPVAGVFLWTPRDGVNRLEAKTVNEFGVEGAVSIVELAPKQRQ
jgi:hypothetical protein